eukprot:CAMPEP_0172680616 /NCGR_PEP_ID=MMETSP1074-20121228/16888_1 /TAXON_ID=2916 /ORGANISM="Ceratium fusus, Strain PA161109" /LENGTH=41 /DNA_ID= /DNA_START= /DNA_END= /DNA_ORIENTATION=
MLSPVALQLGPGDTIPGPMRIVTRVKDTHIALVRGNKDECR